MRAVLLAADGFVSGTWDFFVTQIKLIDFIDIVDILAVTVAFYYIYKFIRDRRAGKLAAGVALLVLLQLVSELVGMNALNFIMKNVFQVGLIALLLVFQPELRSALEKMGGEPFRSLRSIGESKDTVAIDTAIRETCSAVASLSADRTGALIVLERSTPLGDVAKSGIVIDAEISSYLLKNIFFNKAPLHDGAVILRGGRIYAAGCFLPLSSNESIINDLGTRHRAAIGMSENSDAIVIVASEETGCISVARDGKLRRGYSYDTLTAELRELLIDGGAKKHSLLRRNRSKNGDTDK